VEAHRDNIRKRMGIKVVFTRKYSKYQIHREMCVSSKL
jgi:hypothetical protein